MIMIIGVAFLVTRNVKTFCIFSCVPSEENAKSVFIGVLKSQLGNQPFNVVKFNKINGAEHEIYGQKIYSLEYRAQVVLPAGLNPECKPIPDRMPNFKCVAAMDWYHRYYDPGAIQGFSGSSDFEKTEKGWKGQDGNVY